MTTLKMELGRDLESGRDDHSQLSKVLALPINFFLINLFFKLIN